ncbi:hypothetical protein KCU88_g7469, partial [Aureobasidium melanogenum]
MVNETNPPTQKNKKTGKVQFETPRMSEPSQDSPVKSPYFRASQQEMETTPGQPSKDKSPAQEQFIKPLEFLGIVGEDEEPVEDSEDDHAEGQEQSITSHPDTQGKAELVGVRVRDNRTGKTKVEYISNRLRHSIVEAAKGGDATRIFEAMIEQYNKGREDASKDTDRAEEEYVEQAHRLREAREQLALENAYAQSADPKLAGEEEFKDFMGALTASIRDIKTNAPPPDASDIKEFSGKAAELDWWIAAIERKFKLHPNFFQDDTIKTTWALQKVGPSLQHWVFSLHDTNADYLESWNKLKKHLKDSFGSASLTWNKFHRLNEIVQVTSVSDFIVHWEELCNALKLNLEDNKLHFLSKLKPDVKEQMQLQGFTGQEKYSEIKKKARTMDDALFAKKRMQTSSQTGTQQRTKNQKAKTGQTETPSFQPRGKLTEEEKRYRRTNNLCLYCGEAGHMVKDCTETPKVDPGPTPSQQAAPAKETKTKAAPKTGKRQQTIQEAFRGSTRGRGGRGGSSSRGARQGAMHLHPDTDEEEEYEYEDDSSDQ